uniref:ABC transmembrane type-1 domain-containing protein n=1 Tax=Hippocampus comes TaxID=109280 RepID=A0A3Q2XL02_HIPCM
RVMEDLCRLGGLDPLWDWNVTWYTSKPDLTQCFQHTVLVCLPCVFLWTFCPLYLLYLHLRPRLLEIFYLLVKKNDELHTHAVFLLGPLVRSLTFVGHVRRRPTSPCSKRHLKMLCARQVLSVVVIHVERRKGTRSSVLLFLFWTLLVLCAVPPLKVIVDTPTFYPNAGLNLPNYCALSKKHNFPPSSLVIRGFRRPLQADDLWTLRDQDSSERIMSELEAAWTKESVSKVRWLLRKPSKKRSYISLLLRALGRSFGPYFLTGTLCLLLHDAFMFAVPQVLSLLLGFMRDEDAAMWKGFLFAGLLFFLSCLQSLLNHQYMYRCFTLGMRLKSALMALVYRKCLVMSSAARRQCTVGEVINLISVDTQKMMDFVVYVNSVWVAPIEIALCFYFLSNLLGLSALAGIGAVILIFPLNGFIAKLRSKLQLDFMDGRIKLMNEIVSGVKILKFYAWEDAFLRRVGILRDGELEALKKSQVLYSVSLASFNSSSFLIAFAVFAVYVLIDERNVLDAQKIFVSVALINILKTPLSQLPFAMSTTLQAFEEGLRPDQGEFCTKKKKKSGRCCGMSLLTSPFVVCLKLGRFSPGSLRRVPWRMFLSRPGFKTPRWRRTFCSAWRGRKAGITASWKPALCCRIWNYSRLATPPRLGKR